MNLAVNTNVVQTPAGLLVGADALDAAVAAAKANGHGKAAAIFAGATDPDGRRRVVLSTDEKRQLDKVGAMVLAVNLGMVLACRACNQVMVQEGVDPKNGRKDPDYGYGCKCTRIHFR